MSLLLRFVSKGMCRCYRDTPGCGKGHRFGVVVAGHQLGVVDSMRVAGYPYHILVTRAWFFVTARCLARIGALQNPHLGPS